MDREVVPRPPRIRDWLLTRSRSLQFTPRKKCQSDHEVQCPRKTYVKAYIVQWHGLLGPWSKRGSYHLWAYLSFIQHQILEIMCITKVTFCGWINTVINIRTLNRPLWRSFEVNQQQTCIRVKFLILDGWEVCSYTIIPPFSSINYLWWRMPIPYYFLH